MGHDQKENAEKGERIAALATWTVFVLMIIKATAGLILGSIALLADAVHSFADIFASLIVYLGLRVSRMEPSERFPFGYHKAESLVDCLISNFRYSTNNSIHPSPKIVPCPRP
jgi:cation diffusion facilitator family transporter